MYWCSALYKYRALCRKPEKSKKKTHNSDLVTWFLLKKTDVEKKIPDEARFCVKVENL